MRPGDAYLTPNIRAYSEYGWAEYKALKGRHFVCLLVGSVAKDGSEGEFDVEEALNRLGFVRKDETREEGGR